MSAWFPINRKMVSTIWFQFDSIRFRKDFSVCMQQRIWAEIILPKVISTSGPKIATLYQSTRPYSEKNFAQKWQTRLYTGRNFAETWHIQAILIAILVNCHFTKGNLKMIENYPCRFTRWNISNYKRSNDMFERIL